MSQSTQ